MGSILLPECLDNWKFLELYLQMDLSYNYHEWSGTFKVLWLKMYINTTYDNCKVNLRLLPSEGGRVVRSRERNGEMIENINE